MDCRSKTRGSSINRSGSDVKQHNRSRHTGMLSLRAYYGHVTAAAGVLCILFQVIVSAPTINEATLNYLRKYGHLPSDDSSAHVDIHAALRSLQYFGHLEQTGVLDAATRDLLKRSRCSHRDYLGFGMKARRRRRYTVEGSKWSKLDLTYGFNSFLVKHLSQDVQRSVIAKALSFWSSASALTFREASNPDIAIEFAIKDHGDGFPFDGPGGTLAHAFFPQGGSQAHFDADEVWTDGVKTAPNLLQVATHELGHSLGLAHSGEPGSIMNPYYAPYSPTFKLGQDDVAGIQYIYGAPGAGPPNMRLAPPVSPNQRTTLLPNQSANFLFPAQRTTITSKQSQNVPTPQSPICSDPTIDAIVAIDPFIYVFKGDIYYALNSYDNEVGDPQLIKDTWPEVGGKIDTAIYYDPIIQIHPNGTSFELETGHLFFFRGDAYWKYEYLNQLNRSEIYPRIIWIGFPGLPTDLTAAFIWSGNGRVYFIKGNQYYRYTKHVGVDDGYPKPLSVWNGLPSSGIRAAFQWTNKRSYFFSGSEYYRFNDIRFQVDDGYPRQTGTWWFNCQTESSEYQHPQNIIFEEHKEGGYQFTIVDNYYVMNRGQKAVVVLWLNYIGLLTVFVTNSFTFS